MTQAININQLGGPEVLQLVDVNVGEPGVGEARNTTGSSILLPN